MVTQPNIRGPRNERW